MKNFKLLIIFVLTAFLAITGCAKSIPKDNETNNKTKISVGDVITHNMAPGQDDTFTDKLKISIYNSTEKFDTIKTSFIRKTEDDMSATLQLASVSLSNGEEKIANFDVPMNIGHYSRVEYGRSAYSFDIGNYHFSVELNDSGDYTIVLW